MEKFTISHITHQEVHRMDYKKGIMEQIEQIKSKQVLKFLYELIIAFKENWGC